MAFSVNQFRSQMTGDGARPNLFEVSMPFPGFSNPGDAQQKLTFMCKTAQLPGSTIGTVPVQYFGREIKFAGNRTFADWSVTIINDEDFQIRNGLEQWSNKINSFEGNLRTFGGSSPLLYKQDATVSQYGKTGNVIRQYTFHGIYPMDISAIALDWNATDQIEEFQASFMYDYWEVTGGNTGNAGGK